MTNNIKHKLTEVENKKPASKLEFTYRNSALTDLLEHGHGKTIYRIFITVLIIWYLKALLLEHQNGGIINYGLTSLMKGFQDIHLVAVLWIIIFAISLLIYPAFCFWAKNRQTIKALSNDFFIKLWDTTWIIGLLFYFYIIFYIPHYLRKSNAAIGCNFIITAEQVRFIMKQHAFVRSNVPNVTSGPAKNEIFKLPKFSSYLYFLFAPTIIYKDNYPRTDKINWKRIFLLCLEFGATLVWFSLVADDFVSRWKDIGLKPETWSSLALKCITFHGTIFLLSTFYILLHTWLNIWAELLTFGDRGVFYKEWWNSTTYREYLSTWNTVVHGYIHTYFFKEFLSMTRNFALSIFLVILLSALIHEFVIFQILGFVLPVLFIQYVLCFPFCLLQDGKTWPTINNISLLAGIIFFMGLDCNLWCWEYIARINCPKEEEFLDYFKLRLFTCNGLNLS